MFSDSTVTYGVAANEDGDYELTWTGEPVAMDVLSIVPNATGEGAYTPGVNFDDNDEVDYIVRYLTDSDNDGVLDNGDAIINPSTEAPTAIGNYFIVSLTKTALATWGAANPDYDDAEGLLDAEGNVIDGVIAQYFKVVPRSLEGTVAVNVETGAGAFTYDGKDQVPALGFEDGSGRDLDIDDDYSVTYTDAAGKTVTEIVNAGAYTAHLTGKGGYQNSTADVAFTVGQLDLTGAVVYAKDYAEDTVANLAENVWVDGVKLYDVWKDVARAQVRYHAPDGTVYSASEVPGFETMVGDDENAAGGYDFTLTGVKNPNGSENVVGSVSYTHGVFKEVIEDGSITYDGVQLSKPSDPDGGLNGAILDLSVNPYDTSEIAVAGHDAEDYSVSLSTEDAAAPGTYTTIVRMSNEPANYSLGGSDFATFSVVKGEIDTASVDVVALIDGKNVEFGTAFPHTYDALPVVPVITVKHGDATLVEGEDYTVSYTNAAGDPVEEMLEAGVYTVTISSDEYRIVGDASFDVRISPRPFADTYVNGSLFHKAVDYVKTAVSAEGTAGLAYTGEVLEPQFQGHYLNPIDNECVYVDMDPSWYLVSGLKYQAPGSERWVPAEEILEVGTYVLNLTPQPACANYTWAADYDVYVEVVDTAWFTDVATTEWYAEEVNKAAQLGYVQGLGDRLFFPDADMTRAQFAQVLFNMSGAIEEGGSHPTQFTDVESTAWYAEAVSWAVEAGVVNGVSDTQFDPEGKITREQIATMLYRYAGNNAQADASALDTFVDGAQVSDWAANAMAWAVEEGHMNGKGNNDLQPQATATRAEVAALAVRVQPEAL